MSFKPGTIIECSKPGPYGKPVVAVIGYINDWAAYEQAYPDQTTPELIAQSGDKVWREHALELFPELANLSYRE